MLSSISQEMPPIELNSGSFDHPKSPESHSKTTGWVICRADYFGISQYYRPVPELDEWLRRRIRMCYWKQWRWARTKIRHLLALGVSLKSAIQHGVSSHGYWHMARTPVTQQAMSNAWLKAKGLVRVTDLWCKAQGYST